MQNVVGLDRAVFFTLLARSWQAIATLVLVALIARFLSPVEQGYYYTFGSIVALQVIFELGFSFVILQMASHESAHLVFEVDGKISGDTIRHERLASLLKQAVRWYTIAALLMLAALTPGGAIFFATHSNPGQSVAWQMPWYLLVVIATFVFQINPVFSFLEGCGYVAQVAHTRFWQQVLGGFLAWAALLLHHGLYAPAMILCGQALAGVTLLVHRRKMLFGLIRYNVGLYKIHWGTEVWPFQWRIAISWLSNYFMYQIFTPILFAYSGPVAAGQMGLTLSICNGLTNISIAWITTKSAPFGMMIARKEYVELDRMFVAALRRAVGMLMAGSLVVWAIVLVMNGAHMTFAHRVVSPVTFGILLITIIVNLVSFCEALYLRAHKQERFLQLSVVGAILITFLSYVLGRKYGAIGMSVGYMAVSIVVNLCYGTHVFLKYRKLWHGEQTELPIALDSSGVEDTNGQNEFRKDRAHQAD